MYIPNSVLELINKLEEAGYEAWVVGGCVRDHLMGNAPHDYDCCTAAAPQQMQAIFADRQLVLAGLKHGTVGVVTEDGVVEITTFRTEGGYLDSRHPDWVRFVRDVKEDLARRDFTVNAMAYSPRRGLCDPFGGQADLKKGLLRAVGDPALRFREDALRILRGLRFAARFGFEIEEKTCEAMHTEIAGLDSLARERVLVELEGFLLSARARDILDGAELLLRVIPELAPQLGFDQKNPHHEHDIFTHTALVVERAPKDPVMRLAALLHDVGKVDTFTLDKNGVGHFYGHAKVGAELAENILRRLKCSNALRDEVVWLIAHHMDRFPCDEKAARRCLSKNGLARMERLTMLQMADFGGKVDEGDLDEWLRLLREVDAREGVLTLKTLAVKGSDLMALGIPRGRRVGEILNSLLSLVLAGELPNEREKLLDYVRKNTQEEL